MNGLNDILARHLKDLADQLAEGESAIKPVV